MSEGPWGDFVNAGARKGADKAVAGGLSGWWKGADENQKFAVAALMAAAAIGPLGQGLLAAFGALFKSEIPSSEQLEAVVLLTILTLPVAAGAAFFSFYVGRISGFGLAAGIGTVALVAAFSVGSVQVPNQLSSLYCYAEFDGTSVAYEHQCRQFDEQGFAEDVQITSSRVHHPGALGAAIYGWAFIYVADARGFVMAFAGIVAGLAIGYLIRREQAAG